VVLSANGLTILVNSELPQNVSEGIELAIELANMKNSTLIIKQQPSCPNQSEAPMPQGVLELLLICNMLIPACHTFSHVNIAFTESTEDHIV